MDIRKTVEFRVIAESMNETLIDLVDHWESICNNCGLCCEKGQFFLNDYEAHMVAMKLGQLGGMDLIKKHIRFNPRPFNVFTRFMFVFEDECPLHSNSGCTFYEHRPMICKLYPVKLSAFLDNSSHNLREPIFFLDKGKEGFGCSSKVQEMIGSINECASKNTNLGLNAVILYNFFVTTILDDFSFYFCFAQPRGTGQEFFEPKGEDHQWSSYDEIKAYLTTFYMKRFNLSDEKIQDFFGTIPTTSKIVKRYLSATSKSQDIIRREHVERVKMADMSGRGVFKLRRQIST